MMLSKPAAIVRVCNMWGMITGRITDAGTDHETSFGSTRRTVRMSRRILRDRSSTYLINISLGHTYCTRYLIMWRSATAALTTWQTSSRATTQKFSLRTALTSSPISRATAEIKTFALLMVDASLQSDCRYNTWRNEGLHWHDWA